MKAARLPTLGLVGRIVAILLIAVLSEFVVSTLLYERASQFSVRDDEARRLAEHLVISTRLVEEAPLRRRAAVAAELSTDHYEMHWSQTEPPPSEASLADIRRQVIAWEPALARAGLRMRLARDGLKSGVAGGVALRDRSWLLFRTGQPIGSLDWSGSRVIAAALIALFVMASGSLLVRGALQPMRRLADAADRFGTSAAGPVDESGPSEVRQLIGAFNRMQARIQRLIADRTQALAAVGHDLRTPLARLRLRTDAVADPGLRETIADDIEEMEAMVASLLAYLGGEDDPETPALTDIAVLCATLADDAADRGRPVEYAGPDHCERRVRPLGLKRALSNLIENALHYGAHVCLILEASEREIVLAVEDDGPGIPPESLASVLEPFVRLDTARRRDTIGLGLGLAIVARAVEQEGGTITLANRAVGGLRAEIRLPIPA